MTIDLQVFGGYDNFIKDVCVDGQKNIYAYFNFDNYLMFNNVIYSPFDGNWIIAKWDQFGNELWVNQIDVYKVYAINVNNHGTTVACTGVVSDDLYIDSTYYHTNTSFGTSSNVDLFIASIDGATGETNWVVSSNSNGNEGSYCIEVGEEGNVYLPFYFTSDTVLIGNDSIPRQNTHQSVATVLCRFTPLGSLDWSLVFNAGINFLEMDFINNNVFLGNYTTSDTLTVGNIMITSEGETMGVYCKISASGSLEWITSLDVSSGTFAARLSTNSSDETIVYGIKSTFATITYSNQIIDSSNSRIYYLKLDNEGNLDWYKGFHCSTVSPGYLNGISWGGNNDFYSIYSVPHQDAEITLGDYILSDSLQRHAFIPKMFDYSQQDVVLPQGWALVSSFINPMEDSIETLLEDVDTNMIILKDPFGMVYWPQYSVNTIATWDFRNGYQSKMISTDTIRFVGERQKPNTTEIPLAAGWNIISYLNTTEIHSDSIFAPYINNIVIIKTGIGTIYWPAYNLNTIGLMYPGQGYQIKTTQNVSFYYPPE